MVQCNYNQWSNLTWWFFCVSTDLRRVMKLRLKIHSFSPRTQQKGLCVLQMMTYCEEELRLRYLFLWNFSGGGWPDPSLTLLSLGHLPTWASPWYTAWHQPIVHFCSSVAHVWVPGGKTTGSVRILSFNVLHSVIKKIVSQMSSWCQKWHILFLEIIQRNLANL
jgi:hypothetical protein